MSDSTAFGGLIADDIHKSHATHADSVEILRGVSLRLHRGRSAAIFGEAGCGKSTLFNIVGTLDHPTSGRMTLDGVDPFSLPAGPLADFRNRQVGFIFEQPRLLPQCTALENVLIPTLPHRSTRSARDRAIELIEKLNVKDCLDKFPHELPVEQQQRVAIARAVIQRPSLVLADEPTGCVDRLTGERVVELLLSLPDQEQFALLFFTHSRQLAKKFPTCFELEDGSLRPG